MTGCNLKSGFTLLEVLVASMLMAMLITILTMVFNSSSRAWSTGKAGVAAMDDVRNTMSAAGLAADNAIPGVDVHDKNAWGYLVGPWDAKGNLRKDERTIKTTVMGENFLGKPSLGSNKGPWVYKGKKQLWAEVSPGNISISGKADAFVVGVWSYGPDGKENSGDDICTWPDMD